MIPGDRFNLGRHLCEVVSTNENYVGFRYVGWFERMREAFVEWMQRP